ncbi:hypothetical protein OG21DRAFT_1483158 [Imleria badia]|nr:hypothetical protein OG21DRAFT_1483158 [Imleria badia]
MNLPQVVDDPSLLKQEPLCTYIAIIECAGAQRSALKDAVSKFVEEMQKNGQAAAAAKRWACLMFEGILSDESSFKLTDGGEELYKVFFEYQLLLHQGRQQENADKAQQYYVQVNRRGIDAIKAKLEGPGANTLHSARRRCTKGGSNGQDNQRSFCSSGPMNTCRQVETGIHPPDASLAHFPVMAAAHSDLTSIGDITTSSSLRRGSHSTMGGPVIQEPAFDPPAATGAQLFTLPKAVKSSKRSISKKEKKRKASSQKPPVITPSDASEDDKEPSETHPVTSANSVSHRSKRIASNPSRQPHDLFGVKDQVDKTDLAQRAKTSKQHPKSNGITRNSQPQSPLTSFLSDSFFSDPSIKGRHCAALPLSGRKRDRQRLLNVSTQPTRASSRPGRPRKIKSVRRPPARPSKRMRRASMSTLDGELGGGPESNHDLRAGFLQEPTIRAPLAIEPPSTREDIHVESKARRKRTRLQFEIASVASDGNPPANSHESLGPDVRSLRPLPTKVHDVTLGSAANGVPCGTSSLEHADQLLRDVASNALAILQEGVVPDVPDWTEDKEHDEECDDLGGDDQDEANDVQVTTITPAPPKPPIPARPPIWALSRQEVCESSEYFRCYHGGVYSKDNIVKGYLLGAYAASRDIFHHGGKLIISHGGGKSESIVDVRWGPKRHQRSQDQQASDHSVRALLKTCKDRRPIVLLADDKYAHFPFDLASANYTYVVLGLYWISHAWAECQSARDGSGRIVRWKFAFQWCQGQGDPWWLPQQEMTDSASDPPKSTSNSKMHPTKGSSQPADTGGDASIQCENCYEHSPFVYTQGWMCLNPACDLFWSVNGEDPKQLDYREEFLNLLPQKFERLPNIIPASVIEAPGGVATTYAFSRGWHCTNCGRLSCRFKWECWECSNCKITHVVKGRPRSPKEFWHQRPSKGFLHSQIGKDSGILACRLEPINLGAHKGFTNRLTFILPHDRGKIHLILGTPLSNGDADDIFQMYQEQASTGELRLRRYPLRNHRARGLLLTNYFSQNSGEPYQYVGGSGHTVPFRDAPDCVRRALALIKERSSLALRTDIPFNEVLSAAYMERQKMSFHSDSEKGLGPTVASLSLGSAALMHFRPHVNMDNPKSKSTYALTLVLRHGDVLIMDGDGVQKYYEHTVVPMNFRIAATARCIGTA